MKLLVFLLLFTQIARGESSSLSCSNNKTFVRPKGT